MQEIPLNPDRPYVELDGALYTIGPSDYFTENKNQYVFHFHFKQQQHKNINRILTDEERKRIDEAYNKRELNQMGGLRRFQVKAKKPITTKIPLNK